MDYQLWMLEGGSKWLEGDLFRKMGHMFQNTGFQPRVILFLSDTGQCLETFLAVTGGDQEE